MTNERKVAIISAIGFFAAAIHEFSYWRLKANIIESISFDIFNIRFYIAPVFFVIVAILLLVNKNDKPIYITSLIYAFVLAYNKYANMSILKDMLQENTGDGITRKALIKQTNCDKIVMAAAVILLILIVLVFISMYKHMKIVSLIVKYTWFLPAAFQMLNLLLLSRTVFNAVYVIVLLSSGLWLKIKEENYIKLSHPALESSELIQ